VALPGYVIKLDCPASEQTIEHQTDPSARPIVLAKSGGTVEDQAADLATSEPKPPDTVRGADKASAAISMLNAS
jgi:hypothetical protein